MWPTLARFLRRRKPTDIKRLLILVSRFRDISYKPRVADIPLAKYPTPYITGSSKKIKVSWKRSRSERIKVTMAGTKDGAKKANLTKIAKYGLDYLTKQAALARASRLGKLRKTNRAINNYKISIDK